MNSLNRHIQFTVEKEENNSIPFLDTRTTRNPDGSITTSVYRKPPHTDKYLDFNSNHPMQHKRSVARTLLQRAQKIPSNQTEKSSEVKHIFSALKANGYPKRFIQDNLKTPTRTLTPNTYKGLVILPYVKGLSEKIATKLSKENIKVAHKPIQTLGSILKKPKDGISKDANTEVVYRVKCKDCDKVYVGQTSRALKTRTKEHKKAISHGDPNSLLAKHAWDHDHMFDFNNVDILDHARQWSQRLFLEAWHSSLEPNSFNEHIHIPNIYSALINSCS